MGWVVSPKIHTLKSYPQYLRCNIIWGWVFLEATYKKGRFVTESHIEDNVKTCREKMWSASQKREAWVTSFLHRPHKDQLYQQLDFEFLASRIVRQKISVVWATRSVVLCDGSPSKQIQKLAQNMNV